MRIPGMDVADIEPDFERAQLGFARCGLTVEEFREALAALPPMSDREFELLMPWMVSKFVRPPWQALVAWARG